MDQVLGKDSPRIGGWLVLPLIGLIISMLVNLVRMPSDLWGIYTSGGLQFLMSQGNSQEQIYLKILLVYEVVGGGAFLAFTSYVLYCFVRKMSSTPRLMIAWYVFTLAYSLGDFLIGGLIPAVQESPEFGKDLFRGVVVSAIWIPYFVISNRVRATFVK